MTTGRATMAGRENGADRVSCARGVTGSGPGLALRALGVLLGLVVMAVSLFVGLERASAHAVLVSSDPVDGSQLTSAPARVVLTFDEAIQLPQGATSVVSDDGVSASSGTARPTPDGHGVQIPVAADAPSGAYTVSYRIVSADGHVVGGSVRFGIGVDPAAAPQTSSDDSGAATAAAGGAAVTAIAAKTATGVGYLGLVLLLGVGAAGLLWPDAPRRRGVPGRRQGPVPQEDALPQEGPVPREDPAPQRSARSPRALRWTGWALLAASTLSSVLLAGPVDESSGLAGVLRLDGLSTAIGSVGVRAGLLRLVLLLVLIPWCARPLDGGRGRRTVGGVLAVALLVTIAAQGHAAVGADAAVALPVAVVHLAAMALWLGGLVLLLVHGMARPSRAPMRRWSTTALICVIVLAATGEYLGWRQLDPLQSIGTTGYGLTLLLKLALVAVAVLTAIGSRRVTGRDTVSRARLRTVVGVEAAVVAAVLVVTTVLVAMPPARTEYGPSVTMTAPLSDGSASIEVEATHVGPQVFTLTLPASGAGDVRTVEASLTGSDIMGGRVEFHRADDHRADDDATDAHATDAGTRWVGRGIAPTAGTWRLDLTVDRGAQGSEVTDARYRVWG